MKRTVRLTVAAMAICLLPCGAHATDQWQMWLGGWPQTRTSAPPVPWKGIKITSYVRDHRGELLTRRHTGDQVKPYALMIVRNHDADSAILSQVRERKIVVPVVSLELRSDVAVQGTHIRRSVYLHQGTFTRTPGSGTEETWILLFNWIRYVTRHGPGPRDVRVTNEEDWSKGTLSGGWWVGNVVRFDPPRVDGHPLAAILASGGQYPESAANRFCALHGQGRSVAIEWRGPNVDVPTWHADTRAQCDARGCGMIEILECAATRPPQTQEPERAPKKPPLIERPGGG